MVLLIAGRWKTGGVPPGDIVILRFGIDDLFPKCAILQMPSRLATASPFNCDDSRFRVIDFLAGHLRVNE
jgi:hypothetical protein